MRLSILGSNGTYPSPGRPCSGYLVETQSTRIWVDAGPGTFSALWSIVDPDEISAVVVSHRHVDHSIDLLSAFHASAYGSLSLAKLPVFAPIDAIAALRGYVGSEPHADHAIEDVFDFVPTGAADTQQVGDINLRFALTEHSVPNIATRFEANGRSLVYTGDTGPGGDWTDLVEGADVLLSEASLQDDSEPYRHHLTSRQAGAIARSRRVKRLILCHVPPHLDSSVSIDEAEAAFDRPVSLAVPGAQIDA